MLAFQLSVTSLRSPAVPSKPLGAAGGWPAAAISLARLSRPPDTVLPASAGTASVVLISFCFTSATVASGRTTRSNGAAAPATCGVAIDVPLQLAYWPPGSELRMPTPGAARCTRVAP